MKKLKLLLILLFVLFVAGLFMQPMVNAASIKASEGTGEQTASGIAHTGPCYITGILINTNGTVDALVIIYDNTAASGTIRWRQTVAAADNTGGRDWSFPKFFSNGIYVALTGAGASYIVEFIPR